MSEEKNVTLPVLDLTGKEVEKVTLNGEVFAIEPNTQVMFDAVQVYPANLRQATAKTKKRGEVSGGGKKPWRQKGTGRARAGSSRSPLWRHGGIVFGPTGNQNFKLSQNKKAHKLAVRSALSVKVKNNELIIVKDFNLPSHKTKEMVQVMAALNVQPKSLLVESEDNLNLAMSARNIPGVIFTNYDNVSVYDLLNADSVVMTLAAVQKIEKEMLKDASK